MSLLLLLNKNYDRTDHVTEKQSKSYGDNKIAYAINICYTSYSTFTKWAY